MRRTFAGESHTCVGERQNQGGTALSWCPAFLSKRPHWDIHTIQLCLSRGLIAGRCAHPRGEIVGPLPPAPCLLAPPRRPPSLSVCPSPALCRLLTEPLPVLSHHSVAFLPTPCTFLSERKPHSTLPFPLCCSGKGLSAQPGWAFQTWD